MSARDVFGNRVGGYVLPGVLGTVGQVLAAPVGETDGRMQLEWVTPGGGGGADLWAYRPDAGTVDLLCPNDAAPGTVVPSNFAAPAGITSVSGPGDRLMYVTAKSAFRAGGTSVNIAPPVSDGGAWDPANCGNYSAAFGLNTLASGDYSLAAGSFCDASAVNGVALGDGCSVDAPSAAGTVAGGKANSITGCINSFIGGGGANVIEPNADGASGIVCGVDNVVAGGACSVLGGDDNRVIDASATSAVVTGANNWLSGSTACAILAGAYHRMQGRTNSCILAGSGIGNTLTPDSEHGGYVTLQDDTAYAQRLTTTGGRQLKSIVVTADKTLGVDDHCVTTNVPAAQNLVLTLPAAPVAGQEYYIKAGNVPTAAYHVSAVVGGPTHRFLTPSGGVSTSIALDSVGVSLHAVWVGGSALIWAVFGSSVANTVDAWKYGPAAPPLYVSPAPTSNRRARRLEVGVDTLVFQPNPDFPEETGPSSFCVSDTVGPSYTEGPSARIMFTHADGAFRGGSVSAAQWDAGNRGAQSCAFGHDTTAAGAQSACFGLTNAVDSTSPQSSILGGGLNTVTGAQGSAVLCGEENSISADDVARSAIICGGGNNVAAGGSVICSGSGNQVIDAAVDCAILGGDSNNISGPSSAAIVCGSTNAVSANSAAILCGNNGVLAAGSDHCSILTGGSISGTLSQTNTAYCQRLATRGGQQKKVSRVIATGTTLGLDDHVVLIDNALGATLQLSLPGSPVAGQEYWVKVVQSLIGAGHNELLGNGHLIVLATGASVPNLVLDAEGVTAHVIWSADLGEWLVLNSSGSETADLWSYVSDAGGQSLVPFTALAPAASALVVSGTSTVGSVHGAGQKLLYTTNGSLRAGSVSGTQWDAPGAQSCALGLDTTAAAAQSFVAGSGNSVDAASLQSVCFGSANTITGCPQSIICAGTSHTILANAAGGSAIVCGDDHTLSAARSIIGGGISNEISPGATDSGILAGIGGTIGVAVGAAVVGGNGNTVNADSAAVLCGDAGTIAAGSDRCSILSGGAITSTLNQSNTAYAQRLATRGGRQLAVATAIGSSTLTLDEHCVAFSNGTGATMTLTLPATPVSGQTYLIKVVAVFAGPARNMLSGGANTIMDASGTSATSFDLGAAAGGAYSVVWAPTQAKWLITSTTSAGSSAQTLRYIADTSYTTLCADPTASGYVAAANFLMPPSAVSTEGLGARFMYCPNTKSLRCGEITAGSYTYWDRLLRGSLSTCFGSNTQAQGARASVLGGSLNRCNGNDGGVVSGVGNVIGSTQGFIGAGNNGQIYNTGGSRNFIVCGNNNVVSGGTCGGVCGGTGNTASVDDAAVLCGSGCSAGGLQGAVVCGTTNSSSGTNAAVLCGSTNDITYGAARSSILCGSGISATQPDTAYAARLTTLGGRQIKVRIVTATGGSATIDDHLIVFDNTTGATMVFYLPAGPPDGQLFIVKPINVAGVGFGNILDASGTLFWLQSGTTSTTINLSPVPGTPGPAVTVVYSATLPGYLQVA